MSFADPRKNLDTINLHDGMIVADVGAGSGFYTLEAARRVAPGGKVYAIDVQQDLLVRIKNLAIEQKLQNIEVIHGDVEQVGGSRLKEHSVDVVIMTNVLYQTEDREGFIAEVKRILKPGGKVLFIDWADTSLGIGPTQETIIPASKAIAFFEAHQFTLVTSFNPGDHHYGLLYKVL